LQVAHKIRPSTCLVVEFPLAMVKTPSSASRPRKPFWKQSWFGTVAQWGAFLGMVILYFVTQYRQNSAEFSALKIDKQIDAKLNPAVTALTAAMDAKLAPITKKLDDLTASVNEAQGQLKRLKDSADAQNPKRVLTAIREN
jgi:hypothetical protein